MADYRDAGATVVAARRDGEMNYTKAQLIHGYANKVLTVDLGSGSIATPELDPQVRDYFIGGRGLGL